MSELPKRLRVAKKTIKKEIKNPIISGDMLTRYGNWLMDRDEDMAHFSGKDEWRRRLVNSLRHWVGEEESLEIRQFCWDFRIPYMTLLHIREKYPEVDRVYKEIMAQLGVRKKIGAIKKIYEKDMVAKDLHVHLPEYKEVNDYWREMKVEQDNKPQTVVVEIKRVEKE